MTKTAGIFILLLLTHGAYAQQQSTIKVSLRPDKWEYQPNKVEFLTYQSVPAMKILASNAPAVLKDIDFKDGTIEYDIDPVDPYFTSFYFRRQSKDNNECFYFRTAASGQPDAVQYAPVIKKINLWDMLYHYQSAASFQRGQWNHVKLVVSGKQLKAYVNNHLTLQVPRLEGDVTSGALAFDGQAIIANLVIRPGHTEGLSPTAGADVTDNDPRYIRKWQVSPAIRTPEKVDFGAQLLPDSATTWENIEAERRGLINLTRKFGGTDPRARRVVWLKTNIISDSMQVRKLNMGFSDEVWIFINGRPLYVDKNLYGAPLSKQPDGRCSLENTAFNLPLQKGNNEVMIGVANDFYGWGIIAQLDRLDKITLQQ